MIPTMIVEPTVQDVVQSSEIALRRSGRAARVFGATVLWSTADEQLAIERGGA